MEEPYMVSNTIKYSDGTETVVNYTANENAPAIEAQSAAMVEENNIDPTAPIEAPVVEEAEPVESASEEAVEAPQSESEVSDAHPADETAA